MMRNVTFKPGLMVLVFATFFCCLLAWQAKISQDDFAKMIAAGFGGIVAVMIAPYWALYRGKLPLWIALILVAILDIWVLRINTIANEKQFGHATWYQFWYILLFSIPGCAKLWMTTRPVLTPALAGEKIETPR